MALSKEFLLDGDISLKEKYLSFDKEKRIRRMQFFERMLIPIVLLYIIFYIPIFFSGFFGGLFGGINDISSMLRFKGILDMLFYIFSSILIIKYYPTVIQKRAHDFGKDGKLETNIILGGTLILNLYYIYVSYLMFNGDMAGLMNLVFSSYAIIINIIGLISGLFFLYLLFRPGTKGKNEYGDQKYYKLKFLG